MVTNELSSEEFRMVKNKFKLSLKTTITLLVCSVVVLSLLVTNYLIKQRIEENTLDQIEEKARDLSRTVALSHIVIEGLGRKTDEKKIQEFTEQIRKVTDFPFIVVFDMEGIRKSHPDPDKIGGKFVGGDDVPVYSGIEHVSIAEGTLGMSLRVFTPVYNVDGKQIGAVAVGVLLDDVEKKVSQSNHVIYISMVIGIFVGLIGAIFLAKKVKKIMFGMEPDEIAKLLQQRNAIMDNTKEGIIAVDRDSQITLVNREASRLFNKIGISTPLVGRRIDKVFPKFHVTAVMETGLKEADQEFILGNQSIVANIVPVYVNNKIVGAVATFRDKTEVKQMAEQLTGVRLYAEALRAQTHEFMNKLHVILGMVHIECYDKLLDYVKSITTKAQTEVGFVTERIKDPIIAGFIFILGKISYAREKGANLIFSKECFLPRPNNQDIVQDIVTILGNLIDNSIDAANNLKENNVFVEFAAEDNSQMSIVVKDTGSGMSEEVRNYAFEKGYSTKGNNRGIGLYLVRQIVTKLNGEIVICSELERGTKIHMRIPYDSQEDNYD